MSLLCTQSIGKARTWVLGEEKNRHSSEGWKPEMREIPASAGMTGGGIG